MRIFRFFRWIFLGILVAAFPIILAYLSWFFSGFEGSPLSEGGPGHGTFIWFMFYSIPLAFLVLVGGIIWEVVKMRKRG